MSDIYCRTARQTDTVRGNMDSFAGRFWALVIAAWGLFIGWAAQVNIVDALTVYGLITRDVLWTFSAGIAIGTFWRMYRSPSKTKCQSPRPAEGD